jgi:hypothetical protein
LANSREQGMMRAANGVDILRCCISTGIDERQQWR